MFAQFVRNIFTTRVNATFKFQPRWKEELVVAAPKGKFVLEMPMGEYSAYLPPLHVWQDIGPEWARDLWPILHAELEAWCKTNGAELRIDETASVFLEE
jgi:hypothetical protein